MSKPFLIVNVVDGQLCMIKERPTWEEALDCATKLAAEYVPGVEPCDSTGNVLRAIAINAIRKELEENTGNFRSSNGDIHVCITQAD
jgi:hypothetical protein